jgi:sugar phosphate permease
MQSCIDYHVYSYKGMKNTLRYRWIVFWILSLQYLLVYFHRVSPAVAAPELIENKKGLSITLLQAAIVVMYTIVR